MEHQRSVGIQLAEAHRWFRREQQLGSLFRERGHVANEHLKLIVASNEDLELCNFGNAALGKVRWIRALLSREDSWSERITNWRHYCTFVRCLAVLVDELRIRRAREMALRRDWSTLRQHDCDGVALQAALAQLKLAGCRYLFFGVDQSESYLPPCIELLRHMRIVDLNAQESSES